ncbi:MAG: serine/threonine-protein phosphatase, partial [Planctomycetota bacterium]
MSAIPPRWRRRIERELVSNERWRVRAGRLWICPYCAHPVEDQRGRYAIGDGRELERIYAHLRACSRCDGLRGRLRPLAELQGRARRIERLERLRRNLGERPSWRLYDVHRRWYCPFCAEATAVEVPEGGRISSRAVAGVLEHLRHCAAYDQGRGSEKPLSYLERAVAWVNRAERMAAEVRRKIHKDAVWRMRDADGRWVCPHCHEVCASIAFARPSDMLETAPAQIAQHLLSGCAGFRRLLAAGGARAASELSQEMARLGSASAPDMVKLSGRPPAAVSGEWRPSESEGGARDGVAREGRAATDTVATPPRDLPRPAPWQAAVQPLSAGAERAVVLPEVAGLEVRLFERHAGAVASDFVDVVPWREGRIVLVLGTASGGGNASIPVSVVCRTWVRMHLRRNDTIDRVLARVNADLYAEMEASAFVSLLLVVLDPAARSLECARAGAAAPLLCPEDPAAPLRVLESGGMALGVDDGALFERVLETRRVAWQGAELLVLHSAGAFTACNVEGRELGEPRLRALVERYGRHEADYFVAKFAGAFEDWTRGAALREDATVLAVKLP